MKLPRRQFLQLATGAAAMPALSGTARAQSYPTRPVRILVGYPPGGVNDLHARLFGQWLSERLGQQFFIENRAGAGGTLAAEAAAHSAPDGYTLLLTTAGDARNTALYDNLKYDFIRDLVPVASFTKFASALVALPSFSARTVPELLATLKANPGKITIASAGVGSISHMCWEVLKAMTGVDMLHVPYRGEGPAFPDLLGGQVHVMMPSIPPTMEFIKAGKLRPLAVSTASRTDALPGVPAISEFVPGYEVASWVGITAPRNTPAGIISVLNRELNAALDDARIKARIAELGMSVFANSSAEFARFVAGYTESWAETIRAANIKA